MELFFIWLIAVGLKQMVVDGLAVSHGQRAPSLEREELRAKERARAGGGGGGRGGGASGGTGFWAGLNRYRKALGDNVVETQIAKADANHAGTMKWIADNAEALGKAKVRKLEEKEQKREEKRDRKARRHDLPSRGRHAAHGAHGPARGVGVDTLIKPGSTGPTGGFTSGGTGAPAGTTAADVPKGPSREERWSEIAKAFLHHANYANPINWNVSLEEWLSLPPELRAKLLREVEKRGLRPVFARENGSTIAVVDRDTEAKALLEKMRADEAKAAAAKPTENAAGSGAGAGAGTGTETRAGAGGRAGADENRSGAERGRGRSPRDRAPEPPKDAVPCMHMEPGASAPCGQDAVNESKTLCAWHAWEASDPGFTCAVIGCPIKPVNPFANYCPGHLEQMQKQDELDEQRRRAQYCERYGCGDSKAAGQRFCERHVGTGCEAWDVSAKSICGDSTVKDEKYCPKHLAGERAKERDEGKPPGKPEAEKGGEQDAQAPNAASENSTPATTENGEVSGMTLYKESGERLKVISQRLAKWNVAIKKLADDLNTDGWGNVDITSPVASVAPQVEKAAQNLMDEANTIITQGDNVKGQWESVPYVPEAARHY